MFPAGQQEPDLPPLGLLYLAVSAASCLLSKGRDDDAVSVLQGCAWVLDEVHEAGADAAVWHAAAGVAKYHCDDLRVRVTLPGVEVQNFRQRQKGSVANLSNR